MAIPNFSKLEKRAMAQDYWLQVMNVSDRAAISEFVPYKNGVGIVELLRLRLDYIAEHNFEDIYAHHQLLVFIEEEQMMPEFGGETDV